MVSPPHSAIRNPHSQGFTLIELLAVIAIIMLLAGLILAGVNVARDRAKDLRVRRDIAQLKTAWSAYYADYKGFPEDAAGEPFLITESDIACIQILRGSKPKADESAEVKNYRAMNPKNIPYMDFHAKTDHFYDPWGNNYRIALDQDYDGEVRIPNSKTLRQSVAVWSAGEDGKEGNNDDVRSWREL